ncbi:12380_t:CDS:2 [Racocetra persica]|uniref:12380_t:CDS:1 n=1 Tax=Racocetra persica TaxID=160502 RepID=A0ACA9N9R2_9GLOM|nr:12380_t:CDS:2 [Racocetra persica]
MDNVKLIEELQSVLNDIKSRGIQLVSDCQSVAKEAFEVLNLADMAERNKQIIMPLAQRVKNHSIWLINSNPPEESCKDAYKQYITILADIKEYIEELRKPEKFSKTFLIKITKAFNFQLHPQLYQALVSFIDNVIIEFCNTLKLNHNDVLYQNTKDIMSIPLNVKIYDEISSIRKGIDAPEFELNKTRLNSELFYDEDEEPEIRGKIKCKMYMSQKVAVKKIENYDEVKTVDNYVMIMSKLSFCNNIEKFIGTRHTGYEIFIVTEWAEYGNLADFLRSDKELPWLNRLKIAEQIANALEFIHQADILHHDVTRHVDLMVGLSRIEVLASNYFLWEIGTRKIPFEDIKEDTLVSRLITEGHRPKPDPSDNAPVEYIDLIKLGWSNDKNKRPTIVELRKKLHSLTKRYQNSCGLLPVSHGGSSSTSTSNEMEIDDTIKPLSGHGEHEKFSIKYEEQELPPIGDIIKLHGEGKYNEAFPLFKRYATLSHADSAKAKFYCGYYLHGGNKYGVQKDDNVAIDYLHKAADAGIVEAQIYCAEIYLFCNNDSDVHNEMLGLKYLRMAVDRENRKALEYWADILYNGRLGQDINIEEARKYWVKAIKKGSTVAEKWLKKI